ncbi:hypothetical protein FRIGORI9N_270005 [Frigoribacterium sp. 9N]|nr:hypothetical protein FRIGORI9N_270005 [Frigoribacterium sp. 9N]
MVPLVVLVRVVRRRLGDVRRRRYPRLPGCDLGVRCASGVVRLWFHPAPSPTIRARPGTPPGARYDDAPDERGSAGATS